MKNDINRPAPNPSKTAPKAATLTAQKAAMFSTALLLIAALALAPHVLARDPEVTIPGLIPAAESGPIERVQTLSIDIEADDASLAGVVKQALADQLKGIRLDGAELFRIVDKNAPHRLAGSARVQTTDKQVRDRQLLPDYNNCLAHTSRTTTTNQNGQTVTNTTETCSQWGTREVVRECVVQMQTYSARLQLTDARSGEVVYSRVFARAVQPNACGELMRMTPAEFAGEFAREVRLDMAPQRTYSRSALELSRPKGMSRSEKRDWRTSKKTLKKQYRPGEVAADELWWKTPDPARWAGPNAALKEACAFYDRLESSRVGKSAIVLYNRALCSEYAGRSEQAEALYRRALEALGDRTSGSLRERIDTALMRVPAERSNRERTLAQFDSRKVPAGTKTPRRQR